MTFLVPVGMVTCRMDIIRNKHLSKNLVGYRMQIHLIISQSVFVLFTLFRVGGPKLIKVL